MYSDIFNVMNIKWMKIFMPIQNGIHWYDIDKCNSIWATGKCAHFGMQKQRVAPIVNACESGMLA